MFAVFAEQGKEGDKYNVVDIKVVQGEETSISVVDKMVAAQHAVENRGRPSPARTGESLPLTDGSYFTR